MGGSAAHTVGKAESEPNAETGLLTEGSCREAGARQNCPREPAAWGDSVRRTSNHSQQRLLREEVLSLTPRNA